MEGQQELLAIAREIVIEKGTSDMARAKAAFRKALEAEPELREAWRDALEDRAMTEILYSVRHVQRTALKRTTRGAEAIEAVADTVKAAILDTWMVGNLRLGDCTRKDLLPVIDHQKREAAGAMAVARFFESLCSMLRTDKQTVRRVVNAAQAAKLYTEAKTAEAA